jgi:hypothetical protein
MTISFEQAIESLQTAIVTLFGADPGVRSVGIARRGFDFGYDVVRNSRVPLPPRTVQEINGIHVWYDDASGEIEPRVIVPTPGRSSPSAGNLIEEVCLQRPLVCGVQIQNFDCDKRRFCGNSTSRLLDDPQLPDCARY